ncbi:MAG: o-succinylbenzoate--CoA ligase [Ignavibacteriales bacterium]
MFFNLFNRKIDVPSDHPALLSSGRSMTYFELDRHVNAWAGYLTSIGIKRGMHTAILSGNNPDFVALLCALWRLGAVVVPLNVRLLDSELEILIADSGATHLFIHADLNSRLPESRNSISRLIFPHTLPDLPKPGSLEYGNRDMQDIALILYTSGTTGSSKGVMLTYDNLLQSAAAADSVIKHTLSDRWLASLPFYHIGGISIPVRAILSASTIIIPESLRAEEIVTAMQLLRPSLASFVTTTLRRIIESGIKPNAEMRCLLLGGGPVEDDLSRKALEDGWNIVKVYGSTETSSLVTAVNLNENPAKISSAGIPLLENEICIVDEQGSRVPPGNSGEILVKGKSVMAGYWNKPGETKMKLNGGFYLTGDLGHLDEEGYLYVETRRTDLIITGGENVNPLEVEAAILKHGEVQDVCVFGLMDDQWGQLVAAAIVSKNKPSEEEIISFLRSSISSYKIPKKIYFIDEIPKTSLGKVRRDYVRQMLSK